MKLIYTFLFLFSFVFANAQCLVCTDAVDNGCIQNVDSQYATDSTCIAAFGAGFTVKSYTLTDCNLLEDCSDALPVELTGFNVYEQGKVNVLIWQTASEVDNNYFEIQRSINGRDFEVVGKLNGAGNSSQILDYEFIDDAVLEGKTYYRLKQIDFDGQYSYSDIVVSSREVKPVDIAIQNPASIEALSNYIDELKLLNPNCVVRLYNLQGVEINISQVTDVIVICVFDKKNISTKKLVILE